MPILVLVLMQHHLVGVKKRHFMTGCAINSVGRLSRSKTPLFYLWMVTTHTYPPELLNILWIMKYISNVYLHTQ